MKNKEKVFSVQNPQGLLLYCNYHTLPNIVFNEPVYEKNKANAERFEPTP